MIADADLPVWTIPPNWASGITERLSWLTDVLPSTYGPEQRRALRLSPRREFEMTFNPVDQARSYFDLWMHRMGSFEFMVPLFHDTGRLTAGIAGAAVVIPFDTTFREFVVGGLAVLIGDDPFTFNKVAITAIAADSITVSAGGVTRAWPKGTRIYPLRRSRISDESQAAALTNHVGEATLQFQLNQANDIADEGDWDTVYGDYPIILTPPNRRENLDLTFNRNSLLLDNDQGLRELSDDADRAFTVQVDNRMMRGRAEHWAFRQMLYRLCGQRGTIWVPSFNRDIELSRAALGADAALDIKKIGYAYTGGVIDGRQRIALPGGTVVEVSGIGVALSVAEERLTLAAPIGAPFPAGTFASFVDTCRLASDDIEIMHYTDTNGVAECVLGFRSFRDPRTIPDPIYYPIPVSEEALSACGTPADEEAECVPAVPETGYWGRLLFKTNLGPNFPVVGPWSFGAELYREGAFQAGIINADNYSDYDGGGPDPWTLPYNYLLGWNSTFFDAPNAELRGEPGWATDPFIAGVPDELHFRIQWPYNNYIFPGGSVFGDGLGTMSIMFQRINGDLVNFGTVGIFGLWPASYVLTPL